MWVFIQITWSIPVSEQFNPYDSLHGEHSRAGTETGIQEPVAEVAPQAKGARSGLGQQGRVQNRSGACSLTGSPVGGFVWHERYSEVPHRSGGGKTNTSSAWAKGGGQLVPHQLTGQRVTVSGWKLSKASGSFSPVLPSAAGLPGVS